MRGLMWPVSVAVWVVLGFPLIIPHTVPMCGLELWLGLSVAARVMFVL